MPTGCENRKALCIGLLGVIIIGIWRGKKKKTTQLCQIDKDRIQQGPVSYKVGIKCNCPVSEQEWNQMQLRQKFPIDKAVNVAHVELLKRLQQSVHLQ